EAQRQWGKLTNDDMDVIQGDQKKLSGKLQERYGYSKDEADRRVNDWVESL
ncbi:MAG: CsbD family protein, partial [Trueperaceae bacterium]|nr:CsbD family protein [Trueperaceae bacterium]